MTDTTSAGQSDTRPAIQVTTLQLALLEADPAQPRKHFDPDALAELGKSIKDEGLLQPIVVRPLEDGRQQIVAGERRWRAAKAAGLTEIPALVRPDLVGKDVLVLQLVENLQREDLAPVDVGHGCAALMARVGLEDAARRLKKSQAWVSTHASLVKLPEPVKSALDAGAINSPDVAVSLGKLHELDKSMASRRLEEFSIAAKGKDPYSRAPTRAMIRTDLKKAEERAERKAEKSAEQKKERQKVAALKEKAKAGDKKAAAKVAEIEAAKANPNAARDDLQARSRKYKSEAQAFEKRAQTALYAATKIPQPKQQAWNSPIQVQTCYHGSEWNPAPPPKDIDSDSFTVHAMGEYVEIAAVAKVLQVEPKISLREIDDGLTLAEAKRIGDILGARATFEFRDKRSGKKLRALLDPTAPAAASKPVAAAGVDRFGVAAFLKACTVKATPAHRVTSADLHAAYAAWATKAPDVDHALKADDKRWSAELKAAGLTSIRSNGTKWQGIKLLGVKS